MVFTVICCAGFAFVVLAFAGVFHRKGRKNRARFQRRNFPVVHDPASEIVWKNEAKNILARDQLEYLQMAERHASAPNEFPMPVPPAASFTND